MACENSSMCCNSGSCVCNDKKEEKPDSVVPPNIPLILGNGLREISLGNIAAGMWWYQDSRKADVPLPNGVYIVGIEVPPNDSHEEGSDDDYLDVGTFPSYEAVMEVIIDEQALRADFVYPFCESGFGIDSHPSFKYDVWFVPFGIHTEPRKLVAKVEWMFFDEGESLAYLIENHN